RSIATTVIEDVHHVSPETEVRSHLITLDDAWDFQEVFATLHDLARSFTFDIDREDYLVHMTTGTHVVQICLFLLTEARYFPARLLQTSPPRRKSVDDPGRYSIIDLDLSKYDRIAQRFHKARREGGSFRKSGA